jgi:hypothetical protein
MTEIFITTAVRTSNPTTRHIHYKNASIVWLVLWLYEKKHFDIQMDLQFFFCQQLCYIYWEKINYTKVVKYFRCILPEMGLTVPV